MLTAVANAFSTAYGSTLNYVLDETWFLADASLASNPTVWGKSPWLVPNAGACAHYLTSTGKTLDASGTSVGAPQRFTFTY